MKILVLGDKKRSDRYNPDMPVVAQVEKVILPITATEEEILEAASDAEIILVDAITRVSGSLIERMPNLKMIHSEGVAFNGIDIQAAAKRKIYVCNCKGMNAGAVAEQAILLMLGLLRDVVTGHEKVLEGQQIETKLFKMVEGITDLGDCKVGLIGFGDIAKATATRLHAFGSQVYYYNRTRKNAEIEEKYQVTYLSLDDLLATCDIVSIHIPITPETTGMVNDRFLSKMKPEAYFVNTSRGELVDNEAMKAALEHGIIAGAGFDTIAPEPVKKDNPLLHLHPETPARILYAPHIGGITTGSFRRGYKMMWENVEHILKGERPQHIVNGV